jgi:predicted DNA-binding protein
MDTERGNRMHKKRVKQQFSISAESDESLTKLAEELGKTAGTEVKKEILEACTGLTARNYYIALGRLQELAHR